MTTFAFVANSNVLELTGLTSEITDAAINDAAVAVTVKTKAGVAVSGVTWPLTLDYVAASSGDYRAILSEDLALADRGDYVAHIDADAGAGRVGHWEFPFKGKTRTGVVE